MRGDAAAAVGPPGSRQITLSVVIAVDGDADRLGACLDALATAPRRGIEPEVLVIDADDSPAVREVAEAAGARVVPATGSRGARFGSGAKAATGEWLLLLRSGTVLERGWDATLVVFAHEERNRERGAVYSYRAASDDPAARWIERAARFRNRWLGLPSGAQGLVIRRRFLAHLGGVPDLDRGEDLVLARRLGLGRLALFDVAAQVRPALGPWPACVGALRLVLFGLRIPPRWLQRLGD